MSKLKTLSLVVADKEYNSEENNVIIIEKLNGFSVIPSNMKMYYYGKPMEGTEKEIKRGYNKILYNQRNKNETIVSVIKGLFGEHIIYTCKNAK